MEVIKYAIHPQTKRGMDIKKFRQKFINHKQVKDTMETACGACILIINADTDIMEFTKEIENYLGKSFMYDTLRY